MPVSGSIFAQVTHRFRLIYAVGITDRLDAQARMRRIEIARIDRRNCRCFQFGTDTGLDPVEFALRVLHSLRNDPTPLQAFFCCFKHFFRGLDPLLAG
ncbi:hypothetical protein D3C73_1224700 [compost metagenome]